MNPLIITIIRMWNLLIIPNTKEECRLMMESSNINIDKTNYLLYVISIKLHNYITKKLLINVIHFTPGKCIVIDVKPNSNNFLCIYIGNLTRPNADRCNPVIHCYTLNKDIEYKKLNFNDKDNIMGLINTEIIHYPLETKHTISDINKVWRYILKYVE